MAREFKRGQRVADFLRKELSQLIQMELRDPRLGMVSITEVEISRDLSHAKIYVTSLGCDTQDAATEPLKVLNGAAGFLRSQIARSSTMRTTPQLHFFFDESVFRGQQLSSLIDEAVDSDKSFHADEAQEDAASDPDADKE